MVWVFARVVLIDWSVDGCEGVSMRLLWCFYVIVGGCQGICKWLQSVSVRLMGVWLVYMFAIQLWVVARELLCGCCEIVVCCQSLCMQLLVGFA